MKLSFKQSYFFLKHYKQVFKFSIFYSFYLPPPTPTSTPLHWCLPEMGGVLLVRFPLNGVDSLHNGRLTGKAESCHCMAAGRDSRLLHRLKKDNNDKFVTGWRILFLPVDSDRKTQAHEGVAFTNPLKTHSFCSPHLRLPQTKP